MLFVFDAMKTCNQRNTLGIVVFVCCVTVGYGIIATVVATDDTAAGNNEDNLQLIDNELGETVDDESEWCPAIHEPDVLSMDIKLPETRVPAQDTTHICLYKKVPADKLYDIIASKSMIDNTNITHHLNMFGCYGELDDNLDGSMDTCVRYGQYCKKSIHIWNPGVEPKCATADTGIRIGKEETTYVAILAHWHNPLLIDNFTDHSGIRIWYTPKLRKKTEDILRIGEKSIFIPPNTKDFKVNGLCSSECSRRSFEKPFNITSIMLHAHEHATRLWVKQYRDGKLVTVLADDEPFHSRHPITHKFTDPVQFKPGDEFRIECTYDTTGTNEWTITGTGEMCEALMNYYPAHEFRMDDCFSVAERCQKTADDFAPGCQLYDILDSARTHKQELLTHCDISEGVTCPTQCADVIQRIKTENENCFAKQPVGVSRFLFASQLPYMMSVNKTFIDEVSKAIHGCELPIH